MIFIRLLCRDRACPFSTQTNLMEILKQKMKSISNLPPSPCSENLFLQQCFLKPVQLI